MNSQLKTLAGLLICFTLGTGIAAAEASTNNQTDSLSPVLPASGVPFRVVIEQAFELPVGFHSGMFAQYKGLWIYIAGRINGLHGFDPTNNFPPDEQNTSIYVVNPATGQTYSRSIKGSGLTQQQIDSLSVTSPQGYQEGDTLYMTGGYGIDTETGEFSTKPILTAFYLPGIIAWVMQPEGGQTLSQNILQTRHAIFQISGGEMYKLGTDTQLVFGQNFTGQYTDSSNGVYSKQVRRFRIKKVGGQLAADILNSVPANPDPNYRRRDLNVVPALINNHNTLQQALIAYAGVFTLSTGVWTVPVVITDKGNPTMADPALPTTFKQAMNQYVTAFASLYSRKYASTYNIFFGGLSYGFYSGGTFSTDPNIPFINQVTTIRLDKNGNFSQYLMGNQYPVIASTGSNPGNTLLFGAGAYFMPANIQQYPNSIISLDAIRRPTVIGYIVGGIQSTLPNTNVVSDSSASPYVFKVTLIPS